MKNHSFIDDKDVEILVQNNLDEQSLFNSINDKQTKISRNLYSVIRRQYMDLKELNLRMLPFCNNKSETLYIMFLTIEIYIKAEVTKNFNITSYDDKKEGILYKNRNSYFSLSQIGHEIYYFFDFIDSNCQNPFYVDLLKFQTIQEKVEQLDLPEKTRRDYISLRYNCDKQTEFFFENNDIDLDEKDEIKEVMKYVV